MKQYDTVKPFEFVLKINDNIICQRYFNIKNYNPSSRESLEMKDMMDEIMGMNQQVKLGIIPEFFKEQCITNTWDFYNPKFVQSKNKTFNKNIYDKQDILTFEVLIDKEIACSGQFDGSVFQSGVRRRIDIKDIIPKITRTIGYYLSLDEYTPNYGSVKLVRNNKYSE